ncbi:MAG: GGDEF domain-containing protein [Myxococcota bacterium]
MLSFWRRRGRGLGRHEGALAHVLRTLGRHAFDLPDGPAQVFAIEAEGWARRVEEPPEGEDEGRRLRQGLTQFVDRRRRAESSYVREMIPGLRDALFDVVRTASEGVGEDEREAEAMMAALDRLGEAVVENRLEEIRSCARAAIGTVQDCVARRRQRSEARLESMGRKLGELQARVAEAEARNFLDKLTGIPNRAALDARLDREVMVAQLTGASLSLLMLDVDHFKRFNDNHGHAAGDRVLAEVGSILVRCFPRKSDFPSRYGGEEFCVVLPDTSLPRAAALAERFRSELEAASIDYDGVALSVTASVGVAQLQERERASELLERADRRLYAAKKAGRNRVFGRDEDSSSAA